MCSVWPGYHGVMRYGDGGGLTEAGRWRREQVRRAAAVMFEEGAGPVEVAVWLEVSAKSAYAWRRDWCRGGVGALASKGPSGPVRRLSAAQVRRLEAKLDAGPAAAGYTSDQRWTLARVAALIRLMFHRSYSLKGVSLLLHRMGWTPQLPAHRAVERDADAIAGWRRQTWPAVKRSRAGWARGSASPTSPVRR